MHRMLREYTILNCFEQGFITMFQWWRPDGLLYEWKQRRSIAFAKCQNYQDQAGLSALNAKTQILVWMLTKYIYIQQKKCKWLCCWCTWTCSNIIIIKQINLYIIYNSSLCVYIYIIANILCCTHTLSSLSYRHVHNIISTFAINIVHIIYNNNNNHNHNNNNHNNNNNNNSNSKQ